MNWYLIIPLGIIAGVLSGLLGIGGGTVLVPLFLYIAKMDIHTAVGTSLAVIIPTALIGTWAHHQAGQVDWKIAVIIAILAGASSYLGVRLNAVLPSETLQKVFAGFLFLVAIQLFFFKK